MKANRYIHLLLCACVCISTRSLAQGVCASSALAPVYSQTFGTSNNSTTKKDSTGFNISTKYTFHSSNLEDGEYMITPRVANAGKSDWASGSGARDHTGNTNGNMYLINAGRPSSGPVDLFFSTQVNNLCPGSVYSFSAWLVNVNTSTTVPICGGSPVKAKVKFNIKNTSGVILQTYTTPDLPLSPTNSTNWIQYGFQFTLPSGTTSLILEMRDALGGLASYCGNDFAVDDILFSACTPTASVTLSSASTVCSGTSLSINSSIINSPYSSPAYQWQKSTDGGLTWNNIGTPSTSANSFPIASALVSDGGMYRVIVGPDVASLSSATCTTASNSITLTVNPSPSATISSNSPLCSGNSLNLTSTPSGGTSPYTYGWSGPNSFSSTLQNVSIANATTAASGTYSFIVTDSKSCTATVNTAITVTQTPVVATITNISGISGGCRGTGFTLNNTTSGGVWGSSNTAVATISSLGVVNIVGTGSATITYTVTNGGCSAAATKNITGAGVTMHPDVIECNNGISHFDATDTYYGVAYSNSNAGNTYSWNISGGPFSYQGSSSATSQYPNVQLQTGYSYTAIAQFTTNGITCSDTQMVYKNVIAADTIQSPHDTTVCFNSAPIPLAGKVSPVTNTYSWSTTGTGTFANPTALNTTYTLSAADKAGGVFKIYLTGSSTLNATGNCGSSVAVDSMSLSVYPNNTGTNSTQTICSNQALNFTPVAAIPGSVYSWISSVSAGSATGNTPSGAGTIIDSLVNLSPVNNAVIVYTITPYAFTPSNITCTGTPFTFTVTTKPKPAVTITNNAAAICTGAATNIQFSSSIAGSSYTWSSSALTGTITGNSTNAVPGSVTTINDVLTNNTTGNLTERYRITATSPLGCSRTDSTDVLVYGNPTVANAGPDQALCNVTTALLSANNPVLGTGSWSMISGPSTVNFGAISSANSSVNNLVPGTYQLRWTISNGTCLVSKDTVALVNAATTVAGTVSANATVCSGVNSGTLSLTGYTGNIIQWESSTDGGTTWPTVISNTTASYTYTNLTASTYYRAVVQSGVCNAANANPASITVDPATIPGTLSSGVSVCAASNSGTLTLSGNTGTIVRWESSTDGGTTWPTVISNTTNSYNYTNLTVTTLFRVIVQSGNCAAVASNAVTITVNPQTVPGTLATSATVCATSNAGTLTLTGYTSAVVRWESSIDNGSTWSNIVNSTNSLAYTNLTATTQYRVSVQSGVCAPQYSNVNTITVLQAVTVANAGTDQILCSTTSATLNGNVPTSGTGTWTALPGNPSAVTFTNANDPATSVNGLTTGTYQLVWTISNGLCAPSQDIVQITVNPQTVPGTLAASATVCATSNSGTLTLTGYTSAVVRWESSIDNGSTWNNIVNSTNTLGYTNLTATTQYRVSVQSGVCAPQYSNVNTITVLQAVTIANAGADQVLCSTTSATLNGNVPTSGTGTWTVLPGNPSAVSFTNANDPATSVNGLTTGTYQLVWTISNGLCAPSQDIVQIIVNPQTVPGTLAASATVCATSNSGTLTLTGYTSTIVRWESSIDNGNTWSNIVNSTNSLSYTNLTATTQYRVSVQSGVCAPQYSNVNTITVLQAVTVANAGTDQILCSTTSATLNGNVPTSGTGTWTAVAGNPSAVTFANANDPASAVNGLTVGTYQLAWTIANGVCASSQDIVQITVNPQTVPGTLAAAATVCATSNAGTLTLTGYTSAVVRWESSIDNGNTWSNILNTTSSINYNNLIATTQYRVSVQSGVCAPQYSNVNTITVLQAVTIANAGTDQVLCSTTSATLNGNVPTSGTGTWTAVAGNPSAVTFANANDPASVVNGLTVGVYQFTWTIANGVCASSQDIVQITVNPQTVPGTLAAAATVCATSNAGTLTLTGYTSAVVRWESSIDNGNTWSNILNTTSSINYNNLTATTQYRVSVQSGVCAPQYSNVNTITVLQAVTVANAGTDQVLCSTTSATLNGNVPTSGTGTWIALPGNPSAVSFTNANDPASAVNGLTVGTYQLAWTIANGVCASSQDVVQITVNPQTVPGTLAAAATVCATSNAGTLTLTGYTSAVVRWESSIDNGSTWSNIVNTTNSLSYTNLTATTQYRVSVQSGVCAPQYSNVNTITVLQAVTLANAGTDQILCSTTSATLNGNVPTSGTGTWTALPGNPSAVTFTNANDPASAVNGLTVGTYQLTWTIANGVCASSQDIVQITVNPQTVPGTLAASATVCATSNSGTLTLTGYTSTIVRWESSIDNGSTWSNIVNTTNSLSYTNLTATTQYRVSVQSGVCAPQYSNVNTITVLQAVTVANAGTDQVLCSTTSATLNGNVPTSGTGTWTALPGNPSAVTFTNANDPATSVNGLTTGTYQLVWTISNGLCAPSQDIVQITVNPQTVPGTLAASATVCATSNSGTLTLTGYTSAVVRWESSVDNGSTWSNIVNSTNSLSYTNLTATTQYRVSVQSGVCAPQYSNVNTITVLQPVTVSNAGVDQALCNVTTTQLNGNTPGSGTGSWSFVSGPSAVTFTNATDPTTTINGLTTGTYQLTWSIANGSCAASQDNVQLTVYSATVPGTLAADATVCATANAGTVSLTGYSSSILNWQSSIDNGTTWNNIANTTNSLSYTNLTGSTKYRASVQNAVCPSLYSNIVTVNVVPAVSTADAGADIIVINGIASTLLNAVVPVSGIGTWTQVSGPTTVSFSNVNDPKATVSGLTFMAGTPATDGIYQLSWRVSNGVCAFSEDIVQITVQPPTNPGDIGPDAVVCTSNNHGTLELQHYQGTILQWEQSTDYGVTWNIIPGTVGTDQHTYDYNNLTTTTLFRALVKNGIGEELYSGIAATVTVLQLVTPSNAGPDQSICNSTTATLAGNTPASGTGKWTQESGPTTATFSNATDPASIVNGLTIGTYKFAWTISNGICSDSKTVVQITVYPPTIAGTLAAAATVCATANTATLSLTGYVSSIVRWESSLDGTTWSNIASTSDSYVYTNLNATTAFRAYVQNTVCPALYSNVVTVNVMQAVTPANAGTDQQLCNVTVATLAGNTPTSGTGLWSFVSGPSAVSFTNANDPAATVNGLTTGTYQLAWTISNALCSPSQDIVEITVYPPTVAGTLAGAATVCATANAGSLTLTGFVSSVLKWESSLDGTIWNNIANTTSSLPYTNLTATTSYRTYVQNAICPALYSNAVTINVVQAVTTANAGTDQQLCNVSSATLAANTPTSGTGLWTAVGTNPSTVTFTNPNDPATTVNGLIAGTYQFVWTISNAVCSSSQDMVEITVYPPTVAGTLASAATVCATANAGTLSLTGFVSTVLKWESSVDGTTWNNIANTTSSLPYTNLTATTSYRTYVQNAVCPALYSNAVTINVVQAVTTANAGTDQQLCNVSSATLAGNTPTSGTGLWTAVGTNPSTVTFTNVNDPATTVNGLTAGVYQFVWTISNAVCSSSQDMVEVIVYPPTIAGTLASAATVCATANTGTLTLTGFVSSVLKWESSLDGTIWNNIANTTSSLPYTNLTATTSYRTYVQNAICPALYSNAVTINVVQAVTTANAGTDQQLCNVSSATLAANTPTSGTGSWTAVGTNPSAVTFTNANDPAATVNGLTAGVYQFVWTISNAVCSSSQDMVEITVYPPTVAGTLAGAATVCATANAGSLTLTGFVSSVLKWESSLDGTIWNNIANTTSSLPYTNLTATTSYRTYVQNAICPALYSNAVTINVVQAVTTANAGTDQQLCNVSSATLAANTPTSGTGSWTAVGTNPSAVTFTNANDPATTVNGLIAGTYQFVWTISNAVCSSSQDMVEITVYPPTVAGTLASAATVCATTNTGTLSLTGFVSSVLKWESSVDGTTWNNIANTTSSLSYTNLTATTSYRTYVQNAVCPALYSNAVTINVVQAVTIANAGSDQQLCNVSSATLAANTPTSGTGLWTAVGTNPSAVTFTNANDPATTVNGLTAGVYQLVWTISNAVCSSSQDMVEITVYPPTVTGTLASAATVCATANTGTLSLTGFVSSVLKWESSVDGTTWNNIANTTSSLSYTDLTATTSYRTYVQNAVCPALYSNAVTINVVQAVTTANAGTDQQLCNVSSATLAANTPTSGTGSWTAVGTNPSAVTFTNANDPATTVDGLTAGTYQFVWTISNAVCSESKDTMQIVVYSPTVAGTLASAATVCATANAGTLSLTGFVSSVLKWESSVNDTTWNNITNTTSSLPYTNLTATTSYRTYVQNAICPALYSNAVTINVVQAVTIANAGSDQQLCNVSAASLAANTPTSGTGSWTAIGTNPSAVTFTNPNDPATTLNGLTTGTYQFIWTISNAVCSESKDTVQVVVFSPTVAGNLVADDFVCITGNNGLVKLTGYTGRITQWEVSMDSTVAWNTIANTSDSLIYTNILSTTYYRAFVQNGNCNTVQTNIVTIHVNPVSVGGKLTPARDTICATANTGSLKLSGFTGVIMHWEYSADKGSNWTTVNNSDTTYNYTNLTSTTWYRVLIQSGVCSSAYSDTAIVTVDSPTVIGILADNAVVCATSNSGTISVTGKTGAVIHWEISVDNGNTWSIISNTADSLIYTNLTTTSQYRALIQNGVCATLYSNTVVISVIQPVTLANAGADQVLCNANADIMLQANIPSSGTGLWNFVSGPSTVSFTNQASSNSEASGLKTGTYQFAWTISNGTCPSSTDTVVVKIDRVISGFTVTSVNDCGKTSFFYTNTSQSAFGIQNWKWFTNAGDTATSKNYSLAFTSETSEKTTLAAQSITGCTDTISALHDVVVYQFPKVNINAITEICKSQILNVSSDVASQDSIAFLLWNLGNGINTKDPFVTIQYVEDGYYTVKLTVATINRCFDSAFKQITVHPIPDIFITNNPIVCKGDSTMLTASGAKNYIWTDQNNNIICNGCKTTRVKPTYNTQYRVVGYSEYGCSQVKTTDVRVIPSLKMLATKGDTLCVGEARQLHASGAASYSWYPAAGLNNTGIASPVANPTATTTYHVIGKDEFNCFVDTAEVKVAVGVPTPLNIGKDTVITAGSVFQFNPLPLTSQDIRKWVWKSPVELSCRNCPAPEARISNDVDITLTIINAYGCVSNDTISIKTFCGATELFVPNAFSPDGDGVNDVLLIQGKGVKMIKSFKIFSRWGELVFEKSNFLPGDRSAAWDGKIRGNPAPPDVFVYIAEVICEKGLPSSFKGNTAILK